MTETLGNGELLHPYSGGKTEGIFESSEGDYYLRSGWSGPSQNMPRGSSGFDIVSKPRVAGHAAALMHKLALTEAKLYINNPVICSSCIGNLTKMLPPGAKLEVVTPQGARTFVGAQ